MAPRLGRRDFLFAAGASAAVLAANRARAIELFNQKEGDVPWLAEVQAPPQRIPPEAPQLLPIKAASLDDWNHRRQAIRRRWLEFLGPLKLPPRPAPPLTVLEEDRAEGVIRQLVSYRCEPGILTQAYLLRPEKLDGPAPGVAVFHSTVDHSIRQPAGLEGGPEKAFGLKLARAGYVSLCPRNFLWPETGRISVAKETERFHRRHPHSRGMAKMLHDSHVAIDILAAMPEIDAARLGAVGHSLGAKEVLYLAAFDERVKVSVSSEGGIGREFSNWDAAWYLGESLAEGEFPGEHHELLALAAPRPFLLIGGDSADGARSWPFIEAVLPIWRLYGEPPAVGLFSHGGGHAVPPAAESRISEWFAAYL